MSQVESPGPVDESVGYVLKKAATALRAAMTGALRPLDLTVPQYACLEVLRQKPGLTGSELARAVFVTRQSMNLVLKGLERRGLLTRPATPSHGKALPTELTPAGREQLAAAHHAVNAVEKRMLAALTPEAERRLCADLTACAAALADEGEDEGAGEGVDSELR
ncbi:DNA-binding MarR family transcriptional regulator [Streptomyces sp. Amel2xB2]|uniref:MarR family transcriptional regulator n=1 Tax=Streptomyces nanshensis TaxID=518642 RepID=A0A1E7L7G6_9ACTN|nr:MULTISPECIES: MarR family transcriptional regulator [Streptomyces]OEV12114.1 MarR family transcriptional regulator [Streptomyces nanshensis]RAJ70103.1 DNA-binding MarR family transcriptional regulator [Streptomyces sp. Amel2xB2]